MEALPISALQHLIYCERQCALIHIEQEWKENRFTAEGRVLHERAHEGDDESRPGLHITRGMEVSSTKLNIHGKCDIVEFQANQIILPIEYKRGKPKAHRADEVQLCAQALCLEEMTQTNIPLGYLYYAQPHRRTAVNFDTALRELTTHSIQRLRELLLTQALPPAVYEKRKCQACSMQEICQPQATKSAHAWLSSNIEHMASIPYL